MQQHNEGTPGQQHPPEYRRDLNPEANITELGAEPAGEQPAYRTAYDLKALHQRLAEFEDDDLKRIPVVLEGEPLRQGSTYIDLRAEQPSEFTATGDVRADLTTWYVPKHDVDHELWARLLGRSGAY